MFTRSKVICGSIMLLFLFVMPSLGQAKKLDCSNIVVNLPGRTITLYSGSTLIKEYPVAIGKISTPTPLGEFFIVSKEINPSWYPPDKPGKVVFPGPDNPLGYRWMGFISNDYGIHGTNEPWSIGTVSSNGCLRMYESDVEELFDLVDFNTPVKITYDRAKVFADESGKIKLSIYPDVYGYGKLTKISVRKQLEKYGLNTFITDNFLDGFLNETTDRSSEKTAKIAESVKVKVNDKIVAGLGIVTGETVYIPIKAVAERLGEVFFFDGQCVLLDGDKKADAVVSDGVVYISEKDVETLFGGRYWRGENNTWYFEKISLTFNKNPVDLQVIKIGEMPAVSIKELAAILNREGEWDVVSQNFYLVLVNDTENSFIPVKTDLINGEPFLTINRINEYFNTFVYWNVQEHMIELIYPVP